MNLLLLLLNLHNDDNLILVKNKEVKYYTLTAQVLAMFYNLLPKSGEYSNVRGCTPLLIYCLLRDIRVNISKLIIDFILFEHLLILNRNLPSGMMIFISSSILRLMFLARLLLILIVHSLRGCKQALMPCPPGTSSSVCLRFIFLCWSILCPDGQDELTRA